MNETFKSIYERLTNGKRSGNPANIPSVYDQRGEFERGKESQPTLVVG